MGQPQGCDFAAINRKTVGLYSGHEISKKSLMNLAPESGQISRHLGMSAVCRFCCKSRRSDGFAWNHPVSIRSIESGEDALILATAAVMQHTKHRLVVVEQPVWRAAVGSVR